MAPDRTKMGTVTTSRIRPGTQLGSSASVVSPRAIPAYQMVLVSVAWTSSIRGCISKAPKAAHWRHRA